MLKRIMVIMMVTAMVFSFAACGKTPENSESAEPAENSSAVQTEKETVQVQTESEAETSAPESIGLTDSDVIPGKLYFINQEEGKDPVIKRLKLMGNVAGSDINEKDYATEGIRCVFEMMEWVEIYPDTEAENNLKAWVLKHREDQEYYETAQFSETTPGFVMSVDLVKDTEDESMPWGSFYLNEEECEPGYYDLVFTSDGKAAASVLLKFYNMNELAGKSDEELEKLMVSDR